MRIAKNIFSNILLTLQLSSISIEKLIFRFIGIYLCFYGNQKFTEKSIDIIVFKSPGVLAVIINFKSISASTQTTINANYDDNVTRNPIAANCSPCPVGIPPFRPELPSSAKCILALFANFQ